MILEDREEPRAVQPEVAQTAVNRLVETHLPETRTATCAVPNRPVLPTSTHTPGCSVAEHGGESEAGVKLRHHTGFPSPSSLDPIHLEI